MQALGYILRWSGHNLFQHIFNISAHNSVQSKNLALLTLYAMVNKNEKRNQISEVQTAFLVSISLLPNDSLLYAVYNRISPNFVYCSEYGQFDMMTPVVSQTGSRYVFRGA